MDISKVLIANRGECAIRIQNTLRSMGMKSVIIFSDADWGSEHVRLADEAYRVGAGPSADSYLRQDLIIEIAHNANCIAIHPGYGFLAENSEFANKVIDAGLIWIGPNPDLIDLFGDKSWRGSECVMGIRLRYNDYVGGCLILMADHFKSVNDKDKKIITYLGQYLSIGIRKLQRIEKLLGDKDYQIRISNLFNQINISSKEDDLLDEVKDICRSFLRYDKLTITFPKSDFTKAKVKMIDGFNEDSKLGDVIEIENTLHGLAYKFGERINSSNWREKYQVKGRFIQGDIEQYDFSSILSIPIKYDDNILGVISIEKLEENIFSDKDVQFIQLLSDTMGSILSWRNEYLKMYKSAIHDGLTDLLNHKAYKERLAEELSRAKRFEQSIVLLILDLDKFKRINDTYGHLYGDYVLGEVSKILKDSVRNIDVCARYGGEEFAIVLVNTDVENARPVAERIIQRVSEFQFNKDGIEEKMTISAGISEYPKNSTEMKELIAHADLAMYEVKKNGGNAVIAHEDY